MSSINRVSPDPPSTPQQMTSERSDHRRGAPSPSQHIPDQSKNMQSGNVTAPQKISDEFRKSPIDLHRQDLHSVERRRPRIDKHA